MAFKKSAGVFILSGIWTGSASEPYERRRLFTILAEVSVMARLLLLFNKRGRKRRQSANAMLDTSVHTILNLKTCQLWTLK